MGRKINCIDRFLSPQWIKKFSAVCLIGSCVKVIKTNRKQQLIVIILLLLLLYYLVCIVTFFCFTLFKNINGGKFYNRLRSMFNLILIFGFCFLYSYCLLVFPLVYIIVFFDL